MEIFARVVFIIHSCFEFLFGASAFLSGASSSQSAAERAAQSTEIKIAFASWAAPSWPWAVWGAGDFRCGCAIVHREIYRLGLAAFHCLGANGNLCSAAPTFKVYARPLTLGALIVHGSLALGVVAVVLSI